MYTTFQKIMYILFFLLARRNDLSAAHPNWNPMRIPICVCIWGQRGCPRLFTISLSPNEFEKTTPRGHSAEPQTHQWQHSICQTWRKLYRVWMQAWMPKKLRRGRPTRLTKVSHPILPDNIVFINTCCMSHEGDSDPNGKWVTRHRTPRSDCEVQCKHKTNALSTAAIDCVVSVSLIMIACFHTTNAFSFLQRTEFYIEANVLATH